MARYIYDEIKKELFKNDGSSEVNAIIIRNMGKVCREQYNCKAPGEIENSKIDEYKQNVIISIKDEFALMEQQRLIALEYAKKIVKIWKGKRKEKEDQLRIAYDYASK